MNFRHEWKHEINRAELAALHTRLSAVLALDPHALGGSYSIRSLYFDNRQDKVLREKINGVNNREKFRLRYYNGDLSFILLEKKMKHNGLCRKEQTALSHWEAQALSKGCWRALASSGQPLVQELCRNMLLQGLFPKTIVEYTREPFIFIPGNVRVTLDYGLRTSLSPTGFLDPTCATFPVREAPAILEVKWDGFLPSFIRDLVQTPGTRTSAFSKYAVCRIYG